MGLTLKHFSTFLFAALVLNGCRPKAVLGPSITETEVTYYHIFAKSGLVLRDAPSLEGKRIGAVPNKHKGDVLAYTDDRDFIDERHAPWLKIEYKKKLGWIWAGYTYWGSKSEMHLGVRSPALEKLKKPSKVNDWVRLWNPGSFEGTELGYKAMAPVVFNETSLTEFVSESHAKPLRLIRIRSGGETYVTPSVDVTFGRMMRASAGTLFNRYVPVIAQYMMETCGQWTDELVIDLGEIPPKEYMVPLFEEESGFCSTETWPQPRVQHGFSAKERKLYVELGEPICEDNADGYDDNPKLTISYWLYEFTDAGITRTELKDKPAIIDAKKKIKTWPALPLTNQRDLYAQYP